MMEPLLALSTEDMLLWTFMVAGPMMAIYGVIQLVGDLRTSDKKKIAERLQGRTSNADPASKFSWEDLRKQGPKVDGILANTINKFRVTARLQTTLEQANMPLSAAQVLVNLTLVASILLAVIVLAGLPILAAIGAVAATYVLPILYLGHRRKKRLNLFIQQLPNVFELLGQALSAGHSLASAMQVIADELPDPAGTEFGRVFHEQNLGLKIEESLLNLAERVDILDVRFFVTAVLIQRQTGGDLAEVLERIGSVIQERIELHGTINGLTAEGRLSGGVLLVLPIIVFVAMLRVNYDYATVLLTNPTGQMMLTGAVVMMIMGWAMIKKIVNIKV